jgi:formylmethanofuran dehydrogenase subunit C
MAAIEGEKVVHKAFDIINVDRSALGRVAGAIAKRHGDNGFAGAVRITLTGSGGQSFGCFCIKGLDVKLIGEANDYVGKGMNGGEIAIVPPPNSPFKVRVEGAHGRRRAPRCAAAAPAQPRLGRASAQAIVRAGWAVRVGSGALMACLKLSWCWVRASQAEDASLVGNTCLYGATGGRLFVNGRAGERFAVRNSMAEAVVEGAGDHCCEYMTGGCVVVLGAVGRNVAAGMTGGLGYFLDEDGSFTDKVRAAWRGGAAWGGRRGRAGGVVRAGLSGGRGRGFGALSVGPQEGVRRPITGLLSCAWCAGEHGDRGGAARDHARGRGAAQGAAVHARSQDGQRQGQGAAGGLARHAGQVLAAGAARGEEHAAGEGARQGVVRGSVAACCMLHWRPGCCKLGAGLTWYSRLRARRPTPA